MKRYIWSVLALALIVNASEFVVSERGVSSQKNVKKERGKVSKDVSFELIKVKEANRTRSMFIPIADVNLTGVARQIAIDNKLNSKDGLLITFTDEKIDIQVFEKDFGLKLKEKLRIGYYVFENNSGFNDVTVMNNILKSTQSNYIEMVKPNWKMQMRKF